MEEKPANETPFVFRLRLSAKLLVLLREIRLRLKLRLEPVVPMSANRLESMDSRRKVIRLRIESNSVNVMVPLAQCYIQNAVLRHGSILLSR